MTPYEPRRDHRFEYVWEAMTFVEENQCKGCELKETGEYPMCMPVGEWFMRGDQDFEPIPMIDDRGDEGIVCTMFQPRAS